MTFPTPDKEAGSSGAGMRRVLAMYGPAVFAGALATRATDPVVAEIAADFGTTAAQAALLGTAYTLPFAFVQPILGPVADAVGKRRVVTVCVCLLSLMLAAAVYAFLQSARVNHQADILTKVLEPLTHEIDSIEQETGDARGVFALAAFCISCAFQITMSDS